MGRLTRPAVGVGPDPAAARLRSEAAAPRSRGDDRLGAPGCCRGARPTRPAAVRRSTWIASRPACSRSRPGALATADRPRSVRSSAAQALGRAVFPLSTHVLALEGDAARASQLMGRRAPPRRPSTRAVEKVVGRASTHPRRHIEWQGIAARSGASARLVHRPRNTGRLIIARSGGLGWPARAPMVRSSSASSRPAAATLGGLPNPPGRAAQPSWPSDRPSELEAASASAAQGLCACSVDRIDAMGDLLQEGATVLPLILTAAAAARIPATF